jgi:hypothetical protein
MTMAGRKKKVEQVEEGGNSLAELLGMDPYVPPELVEDTKVKKLSPFDFIGAINYDKKQLIVDDETEKQYNAFIVNRGLSNSMDTVIYANEMNSRPHIEKKAQFAFLLKTVTKRKRYEKWAKPEEIENLEMVKEYYGYGNDKAMTALSILTPDQLDYISNKLNKGGTKA